MNFVDFIKMRLPNITALSNISFAIILTHIFAKQKFFVFSYFINFDQRFRMVLLKEKMYSKNYKTIDSWIAYQG